MTNDENKAVPDSNDDLTKGDGFGTLDAEFAEAAVIAQRSGKEIALASQNLTPRQKRAIVTVFRRQLIPPGKPGRRKSKKITAAYGDWKAGMRGVPLYRKHISHFDQMGYWERKGKTRTLMDAIRARKRREQRRRTREDDTPPVRSQVSALEVK